MDERAWLKSESPAAMLRVLGGKDPAEYPGGARAVSGHHPARTGRKLRLFAAGCCRLAWGTLTAEAHARVETLEALADGRDAPDPRGLAADSPAALAAGECHVLGPLTPGGPATQAALLRCVFGNPFRPPPYFHCRGLLYPAASVTDAAPAETVHPVPWLTLQVISLARACYERREGWACGRCEGRKWEHFRPTPRTSVSEPCPGCGGAGRVGEGLLDPVRLSVLRDALMDAGCDDPTLLNHLAESGPHARGCWCLDLLLGKS